jgi:hypothetical protein
MNPILVTKSTYYFPYEKSRNMWQQVRKYKKVGVIILVGVTLVKL